MKKSEHASKKYSEMWDKIKANTGKDFNVPFIHKIKYITTKIKSYNNKIDTDFYNEGLPPNKSHV